jgi:hypothetical protein
VITFVVLSVFWVLLAAAGAALIVCGIRTRAEETRDTCFFLGVMVLIALAFTTNALLNRSDKLDGDKIEARDK